MYPSGWKTRKALHVSRSRGPKPTVTRGSAQQTLRDSGGAHLIQQGGPSDRGASAGCAMRANLGVEKKVTTSVLDGSEASLGIGDEDEIRIFVVEA